MFIGKEQYMLGADGNLMPIKKTSRRAAKKRNKVAPSHCQPSSRGTA